MGLDNGIIVKKMTKEQIESIPPFLNIDKTNTENIEITYWRKCWGIRNEIVNILHIDKEQYAVKLDKEDIPAIIKILYKFLSKDYWEEYGDSIWEYEEIKEHLIQDIFNLEWLHYFIQKNNDIEVEFYDSY